MRKQVLLIAVPVWCILLSGCNLINPDEQKPSYLIIDGFEFSALPGQGSSSEAITEIWVYANDQMLGAFDLPAHIPVLDRGTTSFRFFAGIKNNGIATTRIKYPFYTSFDTTLVLQEFSEHTITPKFRYQDNLDIHRIEFENSSNPFFPEPTSDVQFTITTEKSQVFEGGGSAFVQLEGSNDYLLVRTEELFNWQPGETVFAEMNYSNNNTFAVGVIAYNSSTSKRSFALIFNPGSASVGTPDWKKIYVDLGFVIKENPDADHFEFYIECNKQVDVAQAELYFDNIKLVRFAN